MIYINNEFDNKNKIDILPMIDIIFSILAFLIISSLYLTRLNTIPVDLPRASSSINQKNDFRSYNISRQKKDTYVSTQKVLLNARLCFDVRTRSML